MKNLKRVILSSFLILMLVMAGPVMSNAQDCKVIAEFRDKKLYKEYDKAYEKHLVNQDSKDYVADIKRKLLDDNLWLISDASLAISAIFQFIKTTCNLVGNLLRFNPAVGVAGVAVDYTKVTAEKIYDGLKAGKGIYSLVTDGAEKASYMLLLTKTGPVGQAVKTAWDLADDIYKMKKLDDDRKRLKSEVKSIMELIENEINKYNNTMERMMIRIEEINEIKKGIDKFLSEKCTYPY